MPGSDIERHGPLGIYHFAEDFFATAVHTAEALDAKRLRLHFGDFVAYHLHAHSIELVLKAFLRTAGVGNDDLRRRYGHDLSALLRDAVAAGMALGGQEEHTREVVDWLNEHGKAQTFRYFEAGSRRLPPLADVKDANRRLLAAARCACRRSIA
ncbi:hypothetical protein GCM10010964_13970 [Caldovatus sediminis]|uniref:HEPN domain-containing protein n=1 Tax=Caldovatus sediminis TaxID=2041189 RepID=A0A8J3EBL3_9PROT|nr:hypothetical protein [Caldovatus sediminis]GGG27252.1 hypothetical protein GCM10010964_13970 [Caldovatus sediminis]